MCLIIVGFKINYLKIIKVNLGSVILDYSFNF